MEETVQTGPKHNARRRDALPPRRYDEVTKKKVVAKISKKEIKRVINVCVFCGKSFRRYSDLERHLLSHTLEAPYF